MMSTAEILYTSNVDYLELTDETIEDAKERFKSFKEAGVILSESSWEDPMWKTTDEYSRVGLYFKFNRFGYKKYEDVFGMPLERFMDYVKSHVILLFGRNILRTIENFLLDIGKILRTPVNEVVGGSETLRLKVPRFCEDFFSMMPGAYENERLDALIQAMEAYTDVQMTYVSTQRPLAAFDTYFKFNDLIEDYWASDIPKEERLFFFPIYLWWRITAVIPMRPREFILTTMDCYYVNEQGEHFLTIRRNQLKGSRHQVSYTLAGDYRSDTYKIPAKLGKLIKEYIDDTADCDGTEINTLFVTATHYKKWDRKNPKNSRYLTYINMRTILRYFYEDIIRDRYHYRIVNDDIGRHLEDHEIGRIHLGDTRHLAMINLMQEGCTPETIMLLAGHTNEIMAGHYYSNIVNMIECKTYRQFRKMISSEREYKVSKASYMPDALRGTPVSGGMCYSEDYAKGGITDCVKAIGKNSEIASCPDCQYYRSRNTSYFSSDDNYKRKIEDECESLKNVVSLYRQGAGDTEDIGEVLLRLNANSISYSRYLMEKHLREESEDGKK